MIHQIFNIELTFDMDINIQILWVSKFRFVRIFTVKLRIVLRELMIHLIFKIEKMFDMGISVFQTGESEFLHRSPLHSTGGGAKTYPLFGIENTFHMGINNTGTYFGLDNSNLLESLLYIFKIELKFGMDINIPSGFLD